MFDWTSVNWLAVVAAAVVGLLIGIVWYAPPLVGGVAKRASIGLPSTEPIAAAASALVVLVIATVLALFDRAIGANSIVDGAIVGGVTWFGFVLTGTITIALFENRSVEYIVIRAGQALLSMVAMGALIGAWR